jgi:lipopolysaccharide/colanic/teichoic acid biosynthesis glycosyltransferase
VRNFLVSESALRPIDIHAEQPEPSVVPSTYFRLKRQLDVIASLLLILFLVPLGILVSVAALLDVGMPVVFWQQRLGYKGRHFLLLKIRTLRAPYDATGSRVPDEKRLSSIGRFLRRTRLDEFPQLFNVLVGDMSLIGPRPLLPCDQPADPRVRLMVRPGITGWAQVNGGTLLNPAEKDALDAWYIQNASLSLDFRIALLSIATICRGQRRSGVLPAANTTEPEVSKTSVQVHLLEPLKRPASLIGR